MSDIKDRLKFNSGTDKVTQSVADAVSEVLNSGQAPKSRFEQQAELMGYPLQDKPKVEESFGRELQELRKAVNDDKKAFIAKARQAKKNGDKTFMFAGKEYPCTVQSEDNTNNKSDDGDGLDKVQPKAVKKKFKDRKDKDIDNDGDVDSSDKYLHKRRKAVSKAIKKEDGFKFDGRSKSFKETLRRLGYVKEKSLVYTDKKTGK